MRYPDLSGTTAEGFVGSIVVDLLRSGQSPREIVEQAAADINSNTTDWLEIRPIRGLKVTAVYEIEKGIQIVPNSMVPESPYNDAAFSDGNIWGIRDDAAALVFEVTTTPVLMSEHPPASNERQLAESGVRAILRDDLCRALTLAGNGPIQSTVEYGVPKRLSVLSGPRGMLFRPSAGHIHTNEPIDLELTKTVLSRISKFVNRDSLDLAIDRLSSARIDRNLVDKAIDLGMAIEIITMHDDENPTQEIRHKIGMRVGWLLGKNPTERETFSKIARTLYDARSSAVHKGRVSLKNLSIVELDDLVRRCLLAILDRGRFPNWTDLSFGGNG